MAGRKGETLMKKWNLREWLSPVVYLSNNWISLAGVVIVTAATVTWLIFLPITLRQGIFHPYVGIVIYLLLPGIFILGLLLIPAGNALRRRRLRKAGKLPAEFQPIDLRNRELRKMLLFIGITTFLNIIIASQFFYSSVRYMETSNFCGATCHVMQPEYSAYEVAAHSKVECVACHVGSGATGFVRAKVTGVRQVFHVMLNSYPRPIPEPLDRLRPATETCESCHARRRFFGDRMRDLISYGSDEQNTVTHTVLMMHLGTGGPHSSGVHGAHLGEGVVLRYYASDDAHQTIPYVEYTAAGKTIIYAAAGAKPDPARMHAMQCIDCHNRPAHTFQPPERALDRSLSFGDVSPALPYAKKQGLEILKANYRSGEDAAAKIPAAFEDYYRKNYPQIYSERHDEVVRSSRGLLSIYQHNVFPEMKVTWGTYPNNLGHTDFNGCFRCHDDQHAAKDGKTITQDCSACHNLLATDEKNPKILSDLGVLTKGK
jgi:nitrate/TMAO reductase-like tetraheme cytochrome c subunit